MGKGMWGEKPPVNAGHPSYVTVYQAAGGWQSMVVWWNPEGIGCAAPDGYEEPWETGSGPYRHEVAARAEAEAWAKDWGLELRVEGEPSREPAPSLGETLQNMGVEIIEVDLPTLSRGQP